MTTGADVASITTSLNGIEGLAKEIRVKISENSKYSSSGTRNCIQLPGECAYFFEFDQNGQTDRYNAGSYRGKTASTTYDITYGLWMRPPEASDPFGNQFGIPLDTNTLTDDLIFEVDLGALTDVGLTSATNGVTVNSVTIKLYYREVPKDLQPPMPYIPFELRSTGWVTWTASGPNEWPIPGTGYLCFLMHEGQLTTGARGDILASGGTMDVLYGKATKRTTTQFFADRDSDLSNNVLPTNGGALTPSSTLNPPGIIKFDFWKDWPQGSPFGGASLLNQSVPDQGDRGSVKLNVGTSSTLSRFTTYKLFPANLAMLNGV